MRNAEFEYAKGGMRKWQNSEHRSFRLRAEVIGVLCGRVM